MSARTIATSRLIDGEKIDNLPADANAALALKADKTYVDAQDAALSSAISSKLSDAPSDGKTYGRKNGWWTETGPGGGAVNTVVAGTNISVDSTDPANPVVSFALGTNQNFATDAEKTKLANTSGTNTGDQTATTVPNTPAGWIASTTVQGALNELDAEKVAKVTSTDNAITRFDGTAGAVQNSSVTVDDTANIAGVNELHFVLSPTASAYAEGTLRWNTTDKCLDIETGNNSTLQVGQEMFVRVRNSTGSQINNGQLVYVNGSTGNRPTVALAKADAEATAHTLIGMATDDIANNADGFITVMGTVHDLDTSAFTDGQEVFLSATTAGAFTAIAPSSLNFVVKVGIVTRAHATQWQVLVQTQVRTVSASNVRGTLAVANWGTGLSALGTSLQQIRVNSGGTALEYFTPTSSASFQVEGSFNGELVAGQAVRVLMKGTWTIAGLKAKAGVASSGASIKIDVRKNTNVSTSSVFTSDTPLEITAGSTSLVTDTAIDNGSYSDGDVMLVVITQVWSTVYGSDVSFILY